MELYTAFKVFDKEGNGQISKVELKHILTNFDKKLKPDDVNELIRIIFEGTDGMLNYKEFLANNN